MGRRLIGVAVLVLAIVAAVIVGGLNARQVDGAAGMAPPPGPPAVGDCLGNMGGYGYPFSATVTPCDQAHVGEVVEVMAAGSLARAASTSVSTDNEVDAANACQGAAMRYLGVPEGSPWYPSAAFGSFQIQPDSIAQQAGSSWLVCAVGAQAADTNQGAYDGTLRDAVGGGRFPPGFAVCPISLEQVSNVGSCTVPHQVEAFGTTWVDDRGHLPELTAGCTTLVRQLTGLDDPTAAGRLTVALVPDESMYVVAVDPGAEGEMSIPPGEAEISSTGTVYTCVVHTAGNQNLTGPLLGLDGGPIPLG